MNTFIESPDNEGATYSKYGKEYGFVKKLVQSVKSKSLTIRECSAKYPEACKTEEDCKAAGLHWYDDECYVAEASESESASTPGFGAVFAAVGLLAVVSLLRRK